jgi:formylglycine-generating enzyme required for sulfatase activity
MSLLTDLPELIGFFSYSRDDDEDSNGALSALRDRIQRELRGQLGRSMKTFRLWQDKEAIAPGRLWEEEIKTAVRQAVFFIPIVTPTVVRSPHCKFELESFLAREAELGRSDLVFPILYIRVPELEDSARLKSDSVLSIIARRQYLDWRDLRHRDVDSSDVKATIERFCGKICDALDRSPIASQQRPIADAAPPPRIAPEREPATVESERPEPVARREPPIAPAQTSGHTLMFGSLLGVAAVVGAIGIWFVVAASKPTPVAQKSVAVTPAAMPPVAAPQPAVAISTADVLALSAERERALKPKDEFKECGNCPEMVVVPAGNFTMGSPASEFRRTDNEGPQHTVTFTRNFAVGRFALTFDEWDACVADGGCNGYKPANDGWGRGRRPVIYVSWSDAQAYVDWLVKKTGKPYRLLSEAEREYVTRAGTVTPFWWGSSISTSQANYDGTPYRSGPNGQYRGHTEPVDSFDPNPWGLFQVHGNIYEWTADCYRDSYQGAPGDGSAWTTGDCSNRAIRGGSWDYDGEYLRSASRLGYPPDTKDDWLGFRVGRTLLTP